MQSSCGLESAAIGVNFKSLCISMHSTESRLVEPRSCPAALNPAGCNFFIEFQFDNLWFPFSRYLDRYILVRVAVSYAKMSLIRRPCPCFALGLWSLLSEGHSTSSFTIPELGTFKTPLRPYSVTRCLPSCLTVAPLKIYAIDIPFRSSLLTFFYLDYLRYLNF